MAGHDHENGTDRSDRGQRKDRTGRDEKHKTIDEGTPQPEGFTSPGEGMDDEPVEPPQSKDYA